MMSPPARRLERNERRGSMRRPRFEGTSRLVRILSTGSTSLEIARLASATSSAFMIAEALCYTVLALGLTAQWGYAGLFNVGILGFAASGAFMLNTSAFRTVLGTVRFDKTGDAIVPAYTGYQWVDGSVRPLGD